MTRIVIRQCANAQKRMVSVAAMILTCSVLASTAQAQECGDADGNGQITVTDGVNVLRAAAGLPGDCPLTRCDVGGSGSITVTDGVNVLRAAAGLSVNLLCLPEERFVDNGDGTVTDNQTGLQWEKKTTAPGSGVNLADPHDVDNYYTWTASGSSYPPNGTAFTDFLFKLNTEPCFAGYCDWRLPSEEGRNSPYLTGAKELESILLAPYICGTEPCIDPIFGPTVDEFYWSATTAGSPVGAWVVDFTTGDVSLGHKVLNVAYARAVRGGP